MRLSMRLRIMIGRLIRWWNSLAIVDVRAFGADPSGVRESTRSIQNAIDACPAGGTVYLPPGTYKLNSRLFLP